MNIKLNKVSLTEMQAYDLYVVLNNFDVGIAGEKIGWETRVLIRRISEKIKPDFERVNDFRQTIENELSGEKENAMGIKVKKPVSIQEVYLKVESIVDKTPKEYDLPVINFDELKHLRLNAWQEEYLLKITNIEE